jgi:uridylate kinase
MHVVLSVGGSMVYPKEGPDLNFLKSLGKAITKSKHSFGILTGGGAVARKYAKAARKLGASEYDADSIAITSTKQNAQLVIAALINSGIDVYDKVINDFEEAKVPAHEYKAIVMGGTIPGITTDTDSVLLAEAIGAKRLVNISNVDGVYDSNPKTNKKAKKYSQMTYKKLITLAAETDKRTAGTNFVFDMLACKLIARSRIETHFVSGNNLKDVEKAIEGKKHSGTVVLI